MARIHREVYGTDFFDDGNPNAFYYATLTDLRRVVHELRVRPDQRLVDLGSGSGAPTVWVARETGACVVGVDLSPVGIEQARTRAVAWGVADRVTFVQADLRSTGLESASFDAAMSLDAIDTIPSAEERAAAFQEIARLLRPRARFVHTNWEFTSPSSIPRPLRDAVSDYRPMLTQAGFEIVSYIESPGWRDRDRAVIERTIGAESELQAEFGAEAAATMVRMAGVALKELAIRRRVFVFSRRASAV